MKNVNGAIKALTLQYCQTDCIWNCYWVHRLKCHIPSVDLPAPVKWQFFQTLEEKIPHFTLFHCSVSSVCTFSNFVIRYCDFLFWCTRCSRTPTPQSTCFSIQSFHTFPRMSFDSSREGVWICWCQSKAGMWVYKYRFLTSWLVNTGCVHNSSQAP